MSNKNNMREITGTGDNLGFEEKIVVNPFREVYDKYVSNQDINYVNPAQLKPGDVVNGIVVAKTDRYTLLDINTKSNVYIPNNKLEKIVLNTVEVGDFLMAIIKEVVDKKEFYIEASAYQLTMIQVHNELVGFYNDDVVLTGTPTELNHAGYTVSVDLDNDKNVDLFMPHLLTDVNKLPDPESILNTKIEFILEKTTKDNNDAFIVSRKGYLLTLRKEEIEKLEKKTEYTGFITGTTDYAIFVQFNTCVTAMIHETNLTPEFTAKLKSKSLETGQEISFFVKDKVRNKVFGTQVQRESLWDTIQNNQQLKGKVSGIKEYGVFVQLDYETKGLLHKSVVDVNDFTIGETINVTVANVNKDDRQITLKMTNA